MEKLFNEKRDEYEGLYEELDKKYNVISNIRFLIVVLLIYFAYKIFKAGGSLFIILGIIGVVGFIALVIHHGKVNEERSRAKLLEQINSKYIDRIYGNWVDFEDIGEEFVDDNHSYSKDLDIVGKNSIFQLLNLTNTHTGRKIFAKDLLNLGKDREEIYSRQEGIRELNENIELVQEIEYLTLKNKKNLKSPERLIEYAESESNMFKNDLIKHGVRFLPILVLGVNILGVIMKNQPMIYIGLGLVIVQVLIWISSMLKSSQVLGTVHYLKYNLETYLEILKLIEEVDFSSSELKGIKDSMFPKEKSSIDAIKELDKITSIINIGADGIAKLVLNAVFLWDYQCIFLLEKWKSKYGKQVKDWIEGIGEIESLMSLSILNHINGHINFPEIVDGKSRIIAEELGHPLLNVKERVDNDFQLEDEIIIITGSNMSGKTTFLRTIGINLVLASNGAGVCAKSMETVLVDIFTSMRIVDDLKSGISTFYAEILRVKDIIDKSEEEANMIFLIDEIFTGTNSVDRILGAKNVIGNLNKENVLGMITTHDLELCELDEDDRIRNLYFEDKYDGKKIQFDYKIRNGKSTSTNAKNLMKLAGIKMLEE